MRMVVVTNYRNVVAANHLTVVDANYAFDKLWLVTTTVLLQRGWRLPPQRGSCQPPCIKRLVADYHSSVVGDYNRNAVAANHLTVVIANHAVVVLW